jgi:hypothetical protein
MACIFTLYKNYNFNEGLKYKESNNGLLDLAYDMTQQHVQLNADATKNRYHPMPIYLYGV